MNYKNLGNTDIKVSTICLGTMTWGEQNTELEAFEQMDFALDQGVNFWDTAELYAVPPRKETYGDTEEIIGNWFEKTKKRDKVILATKVGRLGYVHKENEWNKFEDILAELNKYIDQGKIRYVGLSNETPWGVLNYLQLSKDKKLPRMMSIQNPYSLLNRSYEVGLAEVSIRENIGCLAYSPLASGYLSGKYRNRNFPKGSRMERDFDFWTRYRKPNTEDAVEHYYKISEKFNLDMSQMAIKFCEIQDFMTSVIIGATTMQQLKTNIESVNVNLFNDVIKEINQVQTIYPNPCP